MQIDTTRIRQVAQGFLSRRLYSISTKDPNLIYRHNKIQNQILSLSKHLNQSASSYEAIENELLFKPSPFRKYSQSGHLQTSHYENWNLISHLTKQDKTTYLSAGVEWSYQEVGAAYNNNLVSASLSMNVGNIEAKGSCEIGLWDNKEWDPRAEISLKAQASLISAKMQGKIGTKNIYAQAKAQGSVGTIYAEATCILNKDEQKLEAGVGAAALRGEASVSFSLFGAKITLTTEGSLGSAEANISYHHKNREWELGTKLGFIAGLGFKIKVSY